MRPILVRLSFLACAAVLVLFFLIPVHLHNVRANDSAAIGRLRKLGDAQLANADRQPDKGFACNLTDLSFSTPWSGYKFHLECDQEPNGRVDKYRVIAEPLQIRLTGVRVYCMTESRVVWYDSASGEACLSAKRPLNLNE
jgi:hypothetical protein